MNRPHKYGAKAVQLGTERFASKREAKRWTELQLLERAGEITNLKRQVKIALLGEFHPIRTPTGRNMMYVADFVYWDNRLGAEVIEDSKGFATPEYKIKRAILKAMNIEIKEV
jgi:hypothetical protein